MEHNPINPDYYNKDKKITAVEYIHANNMDFDEGSIVKYITRHKEKNGESDIVKTMVYACFVLQNQYNYNPEQFQDVLEALSKKFAQ